MKYPKLYHRSFQNSLVIQLSKSEHDFLVVNEDYEISTESISDMYEQIEITKEKAIELFGKQLKELRLLPLVEQEPSFDYPVFSKSENDYFIQATKNSNILINPKREFVSYSYNLELRLLSDEKIITKQEFIAACGDFIKKANLKEVFTILND